MSQQNPWDASPILQRAGLTSALQNENLQAQKRKGVRPNSQHHGVSFSWNVGKMTSDLWEQGEGKESLRNRGRLADVFAKRKLLGVLSCDHSMHSVLLH